MNTSINYKKYRITTHMPIADLTFYAPNKKAAIFYTEMCGFKVIKIKLEKRKK